MAIGISANTSHGDLASYANLTVTKPTGFASTSILALVICVNTGGSGVSGYNTPTGWTLVNTEANSKSGVQVFWALGSVSGLSFTTNGVGGNDTGWVMLEFTGVDTVTPIDATGTPSGNSATNHLTPNPVVVATSGAWIVYAEGDFNNGNGSASGFTALQNGTPSTNCQATLLVKETSTAVGSFAGVQITDGGSATGQLLSVVPFALRPAASATNPFNGYEDGTSTMISYYW